MKVFRKIADPATLQVVGHDGPRPINASSVNTFPANVPVQPGDILGFNQPTSVNTACTFFAPGDTRFQYPGDLPDGGSAPFTVSMPPGSDFRLNISAVVAPSNSFTLGTVRRNKKRGTATLELSLPNPGELTASGNGVNAASAGRAFRSKSVGAGPAQLVIRAKGKKKQKLNRTGKVKLTPSITFTPTGGEASTRSMSVKLKKKL